MSRPLGRARVACSPELLTQFLVEGARFGDREVVHVVEGLPPDARLVAVGHDPLRGVGYWLVFESAKFPLTPAGQDLPEVEVSFATSRVARCAVSRHLLDVRPDERVAIEGFGDGVVVHYERRASASEPAVAAHQPLSRRELEALNADEVLAAAIASSSIRALGLLSDAGRRERDGEVVAP